MGGTSSTPSGDPFGSGADAEAQRAVQALQRSQPNAVNSVFQTHVLATEAPAALLTSPQVQENWVRQRQARTVVDDSGSSGLSRGSRSNGDNRHRRGGGRSGNGANNRSTLGIHGVPGTWLCPPGGAGAKWTQESGIAESAIPGFVQPLVADKAAVYRPVATQESNEQQLEALASAAFAVASPPSGNVSAWEDLIIKRLLLLRQIGVSYQQVLTKDMLPASPIIEEAGSQSSIPKVAEVGMRSAVRLIISLLRSQSRTDPLLRTEALDFFLEILAELQPLSLTSDSAMAMLMDKSFASVAGFLEEIVLSTADVSPDMRTKALKVLFGLGLVRGSLPTLLQGIQILLMKNLQFPVQLAPELKQLVQAQPPLVLFLSSSPVHTWQASLPMPDDVEPSTVCMATDGAYLYIHSSLNGLHKVGTGFNGSIRARTYVSQPNFYLGAAGSLAFVAGLLVFRSPATAPHGLIAVSPATLDTLGPLSLTGLPVELVAQVLYPEARLANATKPAATSTSRPTATTDSSSDSSDDDVEDHDSVAGSETKVESSLQDEKSAEPAAAGAPASAPPADATSPSGWHYSPHRSLITGFDRFIYMVSVRATKSSTTPAASTTPVDASPASPAIGSHSDVATIAAEHGLGETTDSSTEKAADGAPAGRPVDDSDSDNSSDEGDGSSSSSGSSSQVVLDVFSLDAGSLTLSHVRRSPLRFRPNPSNKTTLNAVELSFLDHGSLMTNGRYVVLNSCPSSAGAQECNWNVWIHAFDAQTGLAVQAATGKPTESWSSGDYFVSTYGPALAYDSANNFVWNADPFGQQIGCWLNLGCPPAEQSTGSDSLSASAVVDRYFKSLNLAQVSEADGSSAHGHAGVHFSAIVSMGFVPDLGPSIDPTDAALLSTAALAKFCSHYLPRGEGQSAFLPAGLARNLQRPLVAQLSPLVFNLLYSLLTYAGRGLLPADLSPPAATDVSSLTFTADTQMVLVSNLLRILRLNLSLLVNSHLAPSFVGLGIADALPAKLWTMLMALAQVQQPAVQQEVTAIVQTAFGVFHASAAARLAVVEPVLEQHVSGQLPNWQAPLLVAMLTWLATTVGVATTTTFVFSAKKRGTEALPAFVRTLLSLAAAAPSAVAGAAQNLLGGIVRHVCSGISSAGDAPSIPELAALAAKPEYWALVLPLATAVLTAAVEAVKRGDADGDGGFVNLVAKPVVLYLTAVADSQPAAEVLPQVIALIQTINFQGASLPTPGSAVHFKPQTIQSAHPAVVGDASQNVTFPAGVQRVLIYFSSRCAIPGAFDYLLFLNEEDSVVSPKFCQDADGVPNWPPEDTPLVLAVRSEPCIKVRHVVGARPGGATTADWGYSLTIVPDFGQPRISLPGILDLQRSCVTLGCRIAAHLVTGPVVSKEEKRLSLLLHSKLLSGGPRGASSLLSDLKPLQFDHAALSSALQVDITSASDSVPSASPAGTTDATALDLLQAFVTFAMGSTSRALGRALFLAQPGKAIVRNPLWKSKQKMQTIAAAFACMVYHSDASILDSWVAAMAYVENHPDTAKQATPLPVAGWSHLVEMWASAEHMASWFQLRLQNTPLSASQETEADKICQQVVSRAQFLLSQRSAQESFQHLSHHGHTQGAAFSADQVPQFVGELASYRAFSAIQRARQDRHESTAVTESLSMSKSVLLFLKSTSSLNALQEQVAVRRRRAVCRLLGLAAFQRLYYAVRDQGVCLQDITDWFAACLRPQYVYLQLDMTALCHPLDNLPGCGAFLEGMVRNTFHELLENITVRLQQLATAARSIISPTENRFLSTRPVAAGVENVFDKWLDSLAAKPDDETVKSQHLQLTPIVDEALAAINALLWKFGAADFAFLSASSLFSTLRSVAPRWGGARRAGPFQRLDDAVWNAFRLLTLIVAQRAGSLSQPVGAAGAAVSDTLPPTAVASPPLLTRAVSTVDSDTSAHVLHQILTVILDDLDAASASYCDTAAPSWSVFGVSTGAALSGTVGTALITEAKRLTPQPLSVAFVEQLLRLVHAFCMSAKDPNAQGVVDFLGRRQSLGVLLSLLVSAPPEQQQIILQCGRLLLSVMSPDHLAAGVEEACERLQSRPASGAAFQLPDISQWVGKVDGPAAQVVSWLLQIVALHWRHVLMPEGACPGSYSIGLDIVELLRGLLDSAIWQPAVRGLLLPALLDVPTACGATDGASDLRVIVAHMAISIYGGCMEGLHVGGSAVLRSVDEGAEDGCVVLSHCGSASAKESYMQRRAYAGEGRERALQRIADIQPWLMMKTTGHAVLSALPYRLQSAASSRIDSLQLSSDMQLAGAFFKIIWWALQSAPSAGGSWTGYLSIVRASVLKLLRVLLHACPELSIMILNGSPQNRAVLSALTTFAVSASPLEKAWGRPILEERVFQLCEFVAEQDVQFSLGSASTQSFSNVELLTKLGFPLNFAERAVRAKSSTAAAAAWLLENLAALERGEDPEAAGGKDKKSDARKAQSEPVSDCYACTDYSPTGAPDPSVLQSVGCDPDSAGKMKIGKEFAAAQEAYIKAVAADFSGLPHQGLALVATNSGAGLAIFYARRSVFLMLESRFAADADTDRAASLLEALGGLEVVLKLIKLLVFESVQAYLGKDDADLMLMVKEMGRAVPFGGKPSLLQRVGQFVKGLLRVGGRIGAEALLEVAVVAPLREAIATSSLPEINTESDVLSKPFVQFSLWLVGVFADMCTPGHALYETGSALLKPSVVLALAKFACSCNGPPKAVGTLQFMRVLQCLATSWVAHFATPDRVAAPAIVGVDSGELAACIEELRSRAILAAANPKLKSRYCHQLTEVIQVSVAVSKAEARASGKSVTDIPLLNDDWVFKLMKAGELVRAFAERATTGSSSSIPVSVLYDAWLTTLPTDQKPMLGVSIESDHPYLSKQSTQKVHVSGARALMFSSNGKWKVAPNHCVRITRDEAGTQELAVINAPLEGDNKTLRILGDTCYVHFPCLASDVFAWGQLGKNAGQNSSSVSTRAPKAIEAWHGLSIVSGSICPTFSGVVTSSGNLFFSGAPSWIGTPWARHVALGCAPFVQVSVNENGALARTSSGQLYAFGTACMDGKKQRGPRLVPELAGKPVVDLVIGQSTAACCTASGDMYAWGTIPGHDTDLPAPTRITELASQRVLAVLVNEAVLGAVCVAREELPGQLKLGKAASLKMARQSSQASRVSRTSRVSARRGSQSSTASSGSGGGRRRIRPVRVSRIVSGGRRRDRSDDEVEDDSEEEEFVPSRRAQRRGRRQRDDSDEGSEEHDEEDDDDEEGSEDGSEDEEEEEDNDEDEDGEGSDDEEHSDVHASHHSGSEASEDKPSGKTESKGTEGEEDKQTAELLDYVALESPQVGRHDLGAGINPKDVTVWIWGDGSDGLIGDGDTDGAEVPKQVAALNGVGVVQVVLSFESPGTAYARTADGKVYVWGDNELEQCGVKKKKEHVLTPQLMTLPSNAVAIDIAAGGEFVAILVECRQDPSKQQAAQQAPAAGASEVDASAPAAVEEATDTKEEKGDDDGGDDGAGSGSEGDSDAGKATKASGPLKFPASGQVVMVVGSRAGFVFGGGSKASSFGTCSDLKPVYGIPSTVQLKRLMVTEEVVVAISQPLPQPADAEQSTELFGYQLSVEPELTEEGLKTVLASEPLASRFDKFLAECTKWSINDDELLIDLLNRLSEKGSTDFLTMSPEALTLTPEQLAQAPQLADYSLTSVRGRFAVLKSFNAAISDLIGLIDFGQARHSWSLANKFASVAGLVLWKVKKTVWQEALSAGKGSNSEPKMFFNRMKSSRATQSGETDVEGKWSMFAQLFHQMHWKGAQFMRCTDQAWSAEFRGEGSIDAGGPFRESITQICTELQSTALPLLVRCPNFHNDSGFNRDKWVLNPSATSDRQLQMFEFFGKMIGLALRSKNPLSLDLPSMFWKQLMGMPVEESDLEAIDRFSVVVLNKLRGITLTELQDDGNTNPDPSLGEFFVTTLSDGSELELKPNGKLIPVTWSTRDEYVKLTLAARLSESQRQIDAVRRGLGSVVPLQLLPILSWRELEVHVCGRPTIDVQFLKSNTDYEGWSSTDATIGYFWEALNQFTPEERSMYLRFVWGRSRLPLNSAEFTNKHTISKLHASDPDRALPVAHTCFFTLDLPEYTNVESLRDRVRYAFTHCTAIDADRRPDEVWSDDEAD